jgi:hypothetical protein
MVTMGRTNGFPGEQIEISRFVIMLVYRGMWVFSSIFLFWQYWGLNSALRSPGRLVSHALNIFCLFKIGSCLYAWADLDNNPIYAFRVAGMTGVLHHTQFYWLICGLLNFLPQLFLVARITGTSHCTWLSFSLHCHKLPSKGDPFSLLPRSFCISEIGNYLWRFLSKSVKSQTSLV